MGSNPIGVTFRNPFSRQHMVAQGETDAFDNP